MDATFSLLTSLQPYVPSDAIVLVVDKKTSTVVPSCLGGPAGHPLLRALYQRGTAQIGAVVQEVLGVTANDLMQAAVQGVRVWFLDTEHSVIVDGASGTPLLSTIPPQSLDKVDAVHTLVVPPRHYDGAEPLFCAAT